MSKRKIDPYHGHSIDPEDIKPCGKYRGHDAELEAERDRLREALERHHKDQGIEGYCFSCMPVEGRR